MVHLLAYCLKWLDLKGVLVGLFSAWVVDAPQYIVGYEVWLDSQKSETDDETCSVSKASADD